MPQWHGPMILVEFNELTPSLMDRFMAAGQLPNFKRFHDESQVFIHHPDGILWVRQPNRAHALHEAKISLRSIAPAILQHFDIPRPDFMSCEPYTQGSVVHA